LWLVVLPGRTGKSGPKGLNGYLFFMPPGVKGWKEMVKKILMMLLGGGLVVGLSLPALAVIPVELHKLTASAGRRGF
jgi:hypothetical protein